jgi:O-methyltransferase/methyltransferase family protein
MGKMDFSDLARLAGGHAEARAIQVAVKLGLFDALADPQTAGVLAGMIQCDCRATEMLLNALVSIGLLKKHESVYSLSEISSTYLLKSSPKYLGGMISFDSSLWKSWGDLERAVRTGKPARAPDMYQNDAEETERFVGAMDSLVRARGDAEVVAGTLDFGGVGEMLDVGSGPATYPIAFCRRHPSLRATIFDLPATLKVSEKFVRASDVSERIKLIPGDYRSDCIPGRYQLAFLSNIIHAEGVEENERLVAKLYDRLDKGGRIVVKDHILDDSLAHPSAGAIFSLLMLLTTESGKCYSFNEVRGWLEQAGFQSVQEIRLPAPFTSSLVIGAKP